MLLFTPKPTNNNQSPLPDQRLVDYIKKRISEIYEFIRINSKYENIFFKGYSRNQAEWNPEKITHRLLEISQAVEQKRVKTVDELGSLITIAHELFHLTLIAVTVDLKHKAEDKKKELSWRKFDNDDEEAAYKLSDELMFERMHGLGSYNAGNFYADNFPGYLIERSNEYQAIIELTQLDMQVYEKNQRIIELEEQVKLLATKAEESDVEVSDAVVSQLRV